ncbi:MAG: hypothetical protein IJ352_00350 [Muribaculaceae bacterium]|nr:hypothetical protein [Muribaculaceae bacterium]
MTHTDNTICSPILDNGFSWKRVKMLANFYARTTRKQIITYSGISFFFTVLLIFLVTINSSNALWGILAHFVISYMTYWSPLIFTRRDFQLIETTLPVSGNEKVAYYFIYTYVIIPASVLIPTALGVALMYIFPDSRELINNVISLNLPQKLLNIIKSANIGLAYLLSLVINTFLMISIALFAVCHFKKSKALMAIIMSLGFSFLSGVITGIIGVIAGIHDLDFESTFSVTLNISTIFTLIIVSIATYYTIRAIKHRQL